MGSISNVVKAIRDWSKNKFANRIITVKNFYPFIMPADFHNNIDFNALSEENLALPDKYRHPIPLSSWHTAEGYNTSIYTADYTLTEDTYGFAGYDSDYEMMNTCPLEVEYVYSEDNFKVSINGEIIPSVEKVIIRNNSENTYNLPKSIYFLIATLPYKLNEGFIDVGYKNIKEDLSAMDYFLTRTTLENGNKIYTSDFRQYLHSGTLTSDLIKNKIMFTGCPSGGGIDSYVVFYTSYSNDYSIYDIFQTYINYLNTGHFGKGYLETYNSEGSYNNRLDGFDDGTYTTFSDGFNNFQPNEFIPSGSNLNAGIYLSKNYEWQPGEELVIEPKMSITDSQNEFFTSMNIDNKNIYKLTTLNDHAIDLRLESIKTDLKSTKEQIGYTPTYLGEYTNGPCGYAHRGNSIALEKNDNIYESLDFTNKISVFSGSPTWDNDLSGYPFEEYKSSIDSYYLWKNLETNFLIKYPNFTNMINITQEEIDNKNADSNYTLSVVVQNDRSFLHISGSDTTALEITIAEIIIPPKFFEYYPEATLDGMFYDEENSSSTNEYVTGGSFLIYEDGSPQYSSNGTFNLIAEIDKDNPSLKLSTNYAGSCANRPVLWKIVYKTEPDVTYDDKIILPYISNKEGSSPYDMIVPAYYAYKKNNYYIGTTRNYVSDNDAGIGENYLEGCLIMPRNLTISLTPNNFSKTGVIGGSGYQYFSNTKDILINPPGAKIEMKSALNTSGSGYWASTYLVNTYNLCNLNIDMDKYNLLFPAFVHMEFSYLKEAETFTKVSNS